LGVWDVATDPLHPRLEWRRPTGGPVATITGGGTIIALEEPGRRFVVHDIVKEKDLGRIGPIDHAYETAALSPDGRLLAVGRGSTRKISVWDVASGREKARFDVRNRWLESLGFSPDSR
jgi:WD40 repeat protein